MRESWQIQEALYYLPDGLTIKLKERVKKKIQAFLILSMSQVSEVWFSLDTHYIAEKSKISDSLYGTHTHTHMYMHVAHAYIWGERKKLTSRFCNEIYSVSQGYGELTAKD